MVETRITNKTFYSNAVPRTPVIDTNTPPVEDPNAGGNQGVPTGSDIIALGSVPNITRVGHTRDIFVALGATMSISYQADGDCVLLPKGGYEDMVPSWSTDGRTMTLTWDCPVDEPADSTYIGVEVWVHGDTSTTEAYAVHWDRLHVGKTAGDIKYIGANTDWPVLYPALATRNDYVAGDTAVITDGTYSTNDDIVTIGYSASKYNTTFPNGTTTDITFEGNTFKYPVAHSNIMAETPLGVFLDRQHREGGVAMGGDNRPSSSTSNRQTQAINILGIDCLDTPYGFSLGGLDSCSINYSASVVSTLKTESPLSFGNGSNMGKRGTRNANFEYNLSFGNQRMLNFDGSDNIAGTWRGIFATNACTQLGDDFVTQTFTGYGSIDHDWLNCWSIDGALYALGIINDNLGRKPSPNGAFITTNGQGHDYYGEGLLTLNTVRAGVFSDDPNPRNNIKSSVFWHKANVLNDVGSPMNLRSHVGRGKHNLENVTMGKSLTASETGASSIQSGGLDNNFLRCLIANAVWGNPNPDTVSDATSSAQFTDLYVVKPPTSISSVLTASTGYASSTNTPKNLGLHYISRIEEGSVLDLLPNKRGCKNLFAARGRYGKRYSDESHEVYDGTGGLPYVNKMARGPWFEFRRSRQRYNCTSNGLNFTGDVGIAADGVHPVDYVNRFGTDPSTPENCPYIDDIYGVVDGTTVNLFWRPVCAAYRATITSYTLLIDNAVAQENIDPTSIGVSIANVPAGERRFEIICIDPTYGNSGKSTPVILTV